MIRFNFVVLCLTGLFSLNRAQLVQFGSCDPNIQLMQNFNATQFLGTWYGIARTDNTQQNGDCAVLRLTQGNNFIDVRNEAVNNNFYEEFTGRATFEQGTAKFRLNMTSVQTLVDFWILMTNYENFAVGYACENIGTTQRRVYLWELGRETTYPTEMMEALVNTTISNLLGIDRSELRKIDHSENACYVLPEIPVNQAVILPGQCNPNMTVVQNFNVTAFGGTWHEISRYYTENEGGTCNRAQYSLADGGVNVLNSQVVGQTLQTISGRAVLASTDGSAKLTVSLEVTPNNFSSSELWIIGTDYENYAISYNCVNLANNQRRVHSWILSRTRQMSGAAQNAVNGLISSQVDLNTRYYQPNDQSDEGCFYFPELVVERPVVFRGQCDMSIPTVQNFDPVRYVGLWHDVESYPSSYQQGTCNNALYTLSGGNVLVYNTQVINQRLDTINGVAALAANDGSAKLSVTFPVVGTNLNITTDYWVLATDYTSYSLVYTCRNINNEEREVYAWKLSRTKQMSAAGNTAINAIVHNITVLNERYFLTRDQSPSACFYYPEPQENLPVVFPGQCDESVSTVNNFNMQQFQGVWYEVAAYPKEQQTGQCIYHNYTSGSANTLNLQSSSVTDQLLGITNGILTFNSTNNSGRLNIRIQTSSGEINIPFWILSVDYNDYALAYSCINDGNDFRKVFSWKLSRTKQLSSAANTTINNVINNNIVLDNVYYNSIDQSDRACFYLPDIPPGQPIILPGQCDRSIAVVQDFQVLRYGGRWRLIESYHAEAQTGTCNDAMYTLNNNVVDVFNTQVINQTLDTVTGNATLASTDGSAKLSVTFPGSPIPADYWVLDTDYDSYALVYGCRNINAQQQRVFSWKLSRTRDLTADAINKINQVINNVDVLNNRFYEIVDQSDDGCFYYPEPSDGPVIFRGQCDPNIRVVTGFNAQRYMNLWHDIESYPTPYQEGTCPNARYQIVDGSVDVFNTQVIDQRLDTLRGQATLQNSNEGSAKLIVTFPVIGTNNTITTNYWVLATDYTSYALVYSCVNINDDYRQVTSWKLSRAKALTAQASAAISAVVNTVPVLDQRYYKTRDQSIAGCFYYPEPQPGVPVIFPGQCDESISAVPNFNLSQFQGDWFEIEAYPKDQQSGQCINHQYTVNISSNTLNLQSFNVLNENLRTSVGVVSVNSTDSSGRLLITLTTGNQPVEIPLWILNTDYSNYALAYSCVNRGSDFRAIYSWKLSRSKQLSAAANTAINNAIANIEVLDNKYYESIDQSDRACFYLPELVAGQPVVFPGQCDPNIAVVQNFNASRYLGRWRMIETYHSDFQSGACNEANYELLPNNTVDVVNTQVVSQELQVDNGNAVVASTDGSAKLLVTFPNAPEASEYWVLGTDYDNYALVYSCKNIDNQRRRVWSWKLSRATQLSANSLSSINEIVNRVNVLNSRYYRSVSHSDEACFYFPAPSANTPVIFPGRCDPNVPVVTNFSLGQYLGLWHDIESYPNVNQYGTCSNARYSLNGSLVDVFNTQVVNQRLDTISGTATLVNDPNGSAKVVVTFPINGTDQIADYWVLSTDYASYALVYSCKNLDDNRRFVGSWKLSRTKQLTAAANAAITNVTSAIQVLDNRYYQAVDQSRVGCFYYPEPQPGVPVVFPGQCDENIQAVPNFNISQFAGIWHEIQAYPKDQQTGQCVNHQYSFNSSTALNLQSFNVLNEALRSSSGLLSMNVSDSSDRLTITIGEGAQLIEIPFWILSTDYSNYALAYSCVNRGSDYRAVYSWKLSRSKQLSAAANTAINNAIANIEVLDNKYYESIDQSDRACFYLPDLVAGQPVVFPGQCDPNIAVVQNFNASRYLGRWRMIETYHSDFQSGACNEANYELLPNNTVDVVNTQVVSQELQVDNGNAVVASTDGSAKLLVTFPNAPEASEYWVLGTDYDNYALVYSCKNIDNQRRRVWSWKLSRATQLSANSLSSINEIVNRVNVLNSRYYRSVSHSDEACFYFPAPSANTPVIFPGRCDPNVPVVTNFSLGQYLGLWHDIESYPNVNQYGTCSNARYSLNGSLVDVFNTQVVNQRLDTISGTATLVNDPNGSAKVVVTFPINGTDQIADYWVLSTDYASYALVYSCKNLDDNRRFVGSWKLSRTKQLTAAANAAITNVTSAIQVLDNRYYQAVDQSRVGCFYYPEPQPGVPVVFPGQCDENIQAVPNFNISQFAGIWHEIQAYPKDQQTGQCVNHQYSFNSSTALNLQSFNVLNEALRSSSGLLSMNVSDSSDRLTITIGEGAQLIEIPFWILSTDYSNYALAYSCVNRGSDYRAVYSWKLSRSKQLSAAANTAINNAIANIEVLDNKYYESIDQSDRACFYLPDLVADQPVVFPGQCDPNIAVVQNFNASRYLGRWRMIETYHSDFQSGACNEANYELLPNNTVDVVNTQVVSQELQVDNGNAVVASTDGSAKLLVTFPNAPEASEYWVLGTDYDNYALVYSCKNVDNQRRRVWSWKLSRDRQLSSGASTAINQIVNGINVLNSRYYQSVLHSDAACFYYPPPSPGTPVEFRGQCDMNISVVTNFNLTQYLGLWHDIESYPTVFQGGTCGNAKYSLNSNVVDVFNTQVVQERLDTIKGVATLASDPNNSAKIVVNFPIAGSNLTTTADYWVLSTDYSSYALVYSCRNINTEKRQVTSWKLSRNKQLSAIAVTAINNVVNIVPVLDARYYQPMDQSPAGCFYYPEPEPGVPVVFPGQCDENIQAVPAFNLTQFQGRWHEIQAYPKDEQSGQCINHQYSPGAGNTLSLQSFNVQGQTLFTSNSVVSINSTDSSGRLLITLTQGNNQIEIPFWILNTDYTNYALAYSCVNRDNDYRAVYSWKLSRTKQLSAAANVAINNTIANIAVLNNDYYQDIDQSDGACFYLPDLAPGEPVEFTGQCDNNIPVVKNFDADRYAGRWRLIETYASDFQSGSCNEATYTLSNGSVIVYNTQVINQTLDTMTGSASLATTDGSGKLLVTFPTSPEPAEYWILDTDYDSYSLVYSCRNINSERRRVWSWKLSRTRDLTANATANINRIIDGINVLDNLYYQRIQHSEASCFYYPTPDKNAAVEFRGQCNENIPVVPRFNLEAYMGIWYDIEGYPQGFQGGSCATANYTLTADGVEVFNTQVVNQKLDTITAVALPASNDGSAKFTVTFPVAGTNDTVSTPYWVLSTDYNTYALAYSCSNINNEYYRVTSWKLSRQPSLTTAGSTAISAVMATVAVLRQQYFVERGHSVEDCRFYPDNNGGPVILDGECEDQAVVTGFSADAFRGTWYEAARFPAEMQTGQCAANTFTTSGQSGFNVAQTFVEMERLVTITATATASADGRGVLNVTIASGIDSPLVTAVNILATDYTSYALLHSCKNLGNQRKQIYSWKLSRSKSGLSQTANEAIDIVVRNATELFEDYYDSSDQSDAACFYYPVFDQLPATITLPGRCNATVRAKPNFNATNFAGKWIEISRYPQPSQVGQCNRPEYVLRNNVVEVINTQVINNTLNVVTGSAIVASADGSGVLEVTFELPGGVVNVATLYILETDYSNFALAYSCRNSPEGNNSRQVYSWKLSRTTSLSNAANNAINAVITNTQGLLNEYYQTTDQSDETCFYVPEVNPNAAPVFRGQCENITGVQGFDIQRYLGWWHEIESYPTDEDVGACISSDYRASGNQYQVIDTNVFGVAAEVNTSTVIASNNGRLRKTLSNGRVIDIWVLATDYETYSLLYSCENINNEYRRVWSAKYSKARQLSQAAQNAMAPNIENNRVLYEQFYQAVDQSDSACFHYREQSGSQIILPGQCDSNIPVVPNFNPTQYTGAWYQIERYPQEHESGNCTGARYTLDEATGVVDVLNWEVVGGVLDTIEGTATVNSTDGSAKLIVRLPDRSTNNTATVEMRLYVLTTDYVSYSLAYSCVNINQFQRSLGVWKLSRTRTMPASGSSAINAYMETREELHQPYFVQVEQSDDCEEPSAAVLVKSSIIVMLVCVALQMLK